MSSAIEIYNRALSRIGITQFISDPAEQSNAGNQYRLWYQACVDFVLSDFPWNFASRLVALAPLTVVVPGWQYAYAYPVDCLMARLLCDAGGARTTYTSYLLGSYNSNYFPPLTRPMVPFTVMNVQTDTTSASKVICSDLPLAYLIYTIQINDPNLFTAGFCETLEWKIASEIAPGFLGAPAGPQIAQQCGQQYRNAALNARAQSQNEAGQDYRPESPAISCR